MPGNLFVVSRLGQLRNVQTFIRQYGSQRNRLAVLLTATNPALGHAIDAHIEPGLFDHIARIEQPERPLAQSRRKNRAIHEQVERIVLDSSAAGVDRLFLCNIDAFYAFFPRVIEQHGLDISVNLLEEGLGTYLNAGPGLYERSTRPTWSDVVGLAAAFGQSLVRSARALALLAVTLLSWALRVDFFAMRRNYVERHRVKPEDRYGTITHFDSAYVYFPEKIRAGRLSIDHIERLDFESDPSQAADLHDAIEDGSTVFVSQKYVTVRSYLAIIAQIFQEMGLDRVHVKFHPREDSAAFEREWKRVASQFPGLTLLFVDRIQSVPVEALVASGRVGRLVGLTSSSLMYAVEFFSAVEVVSVGARFKQLAESAQFALGARALGEYSRDLAAFLDVSDVKQFEPGADRAAVR